MTVSLIDLTQEDIELVRTWRNSPEVAQYMYTDTQISAEQQQHWFERVSLDTRAKYWLIECDSRKIGLASLTDINSTFSSCYWAFYLGDTSVRGGGIGAKVEFTVLEYVFNDLKMNKLRCEVFTNNVKVISMHEKFGFRREAYYRQHVKKNGEWLDVVGLAILRDEWLQFREVMENKIYRKK
jgi:UDP-4-amino-4,6-dideoxy-N-acetyl-beta-L-altrosamine N-acetyltransferase